MASSDDDDISITSTAASEQKEEYEVEGILAEKKWPKGIYYLVKWLGYPVERCTWEPPESFCDPQTLNDWAVKKEAIAQGKEEPFDVEALQKRQTEIDAARTRRKERRKAKRIRLGIPVSPSLSSGDSEVEWDLDGFIVPDDVDVDAEAETSVPAPSQKDIQKRQERKTTHQRHADSSDSDVPLASLQKPTSTRKQMPHARVNIASHKPISKPISSQTHPGLSRSAPPHASSASRSTNPVPKQRPSLSLNTAASAKGPTARSTARPATLPQKPPERPRTLKRQVGAPGTGPSRQGKFTLLSIQRRQEKYLQRDHTPDITQLELRTPGQWARQPQRVDSTRPTRPAHNRTRSQDFESLFVEQDSPGPDQPQDTVRPSNPNTPSRPTADPSPTSMAKPNSERPPLPQVKRRLALPGELYVHLEMGALKKTIGDVRILGLNNNIFTQLKNMRRLGFAIPLNFNDACTIQEYTELCRTVRTISFLFRISCFLRSPL